MGVKIYLGAYLYIGRDVIYRVSRNDYLPTTYITFIERSIAMDFTITVEKLHAPHQDNPTDFVSDPEEALSIVEDLRIQSGKFIYEYPARFRRVIEVIRRK